MASIGEVIYEDHLYKLTGRSRSILWSNNDPWKERYFMLKRLGNKPVLEYYAKKPKTKNVTPRGKVDLWPSFRVEKVMNMKNRAYVFQLTTPTVSWCLSAEEQRSMDVFVFFLQIQSRLKDQIRDDFILVQPENSEAMRRIGAKETNSILHVSPYGVSLSLQSNRAVLAQWPLKSIRFYESSGQGQLSLEAGRVAPMGDGNYVFYMSPGEDNTMYDLLDQYVLDGLAKAQPDRRNNRHEIEDYVQEAENLLALTVVTACTTNHPDIPNTVQNNWNTSISTPASRPRQIVHTRLTGTGSMASLNSQNSVTSPSTRGLPLSFENNTGRNSPQPQPQPQSQPQISNVPRPSLPTSRSSPSLATKPPRRGSEQQVKLNHRPPMPPPSSSIPIKGQLGSTRKPDEQYLRMDSSFSRSNSSQSPNSPFTPGSEDWMPPPTFKDVMRHGSRPTIMEDDSNPLDNAYLQPINANDISTTTNAPMSVKQLQRQIQVENEQDSYLTPSTIEQQSGVKGQTVTPPKGRMRRLRSASCEDVSDYLRSVRYDPVSRSTGNLLEDFGVDDDDGEERLPEPFPRLQTFSSIDFEDHTKESYYNIDGLKGVVDNTPGLPVVEIRKRFTKKRGKLRRSVSNPNFVGSLNKERIHSVRVSVGMEKSFRSPNRSLRNLLPDNLKKRLSKDSGRSGAASGGTSPYGSKASSTTSSPSSTLRRKTEHHDDDYIASTTVKGINITRRSRSFRKQKTNGEGSSTGSEPVPTGNGSQTKPSAAGSGNDASTTTNGFPQRKPLPKLAPKPSPKPAGKSKAVAVKSEEQNGNVDMYNDARSETTEV